MIDKTTQARVPENPTSPPGPTLWNELKDLEELMDRAFEVAMHLHERFDGVLRPEDDQEKLLDTVTLNSGYPRPNSGAVTQVILLKQSAQKILSTLHRLSDRAQV